jgi:hypothetical protein
MADKIIYIDENGIPSDDPANVKPEQKVIWQSTNERQFTVKFTWKVPFPITSIKWLDKKEKGKKVDGKVKSHGPGKFHYPYDVTMNTALGPKSGPELIVDGGRPKRKKKSAARKEAFKGNAAKRSGAKKSARSPSSGRRKSANKAVKSGARTKRRQPAGETSGAGGF